MIYIVYTRVIFIVIFIVLRRLLWITGLLLLLLIQSNVFRQLNCSASRSLQFTYILTGFANYTSDDMRRHLEFSSQLNIFVRSKSFLTNFFINVVLCFPLAIGRAYNNYLTLSSCLAFFRRQWCYFNRGPRKFNNIFNERAFGTNYCSDGYIRYIQEDSLRLRHLAHELST